MIEVNLLPGAKRRKSRPSVRIPVSLPSLDGLPSMDRWMAFIVAAWVIGPAVTGWLYWDTQNQKDELTVQIERAVRDSTRYARIIQTSERLRARQDTIAEKLEIIQKIDTRRYVWAHIMDEVSRALPEFTWLSGLVQLEGGAEPTFRIQGYTGNNFALTRFMTRLEQSPFIEGVKLTSSEQVEEEGERVYAFMLEAGYREPSPEEVEMVPLFAAEE